MTDYCIFPVATLKSEGIQTCNQKCTYVGNYNSTSENNKLIQEAPYTMCNMIYKGSSDVMFNGVSYSNTIATNIIEISLTKPLHTFDSSLNAVGELIIRHQSGGYDDLWVCIPVVDITNPVYKASSNLKKSSSTLVEQIINNLPGIPYVKYDDETTLLRMGNSTHTLANENKIKSHMHTVDGQNKSHTHYHIPNEHNIVPGTDAYSEDQEIANTITTGGDNISNQIDLNYDFKLNDVIPTAPYYYYKGLYSVDCSTSATYGSSGTRIINVIVFDIKDAISISGALAAALNINSIAKSEKTTSKSTPLLLDNCYVAQPDTNDNVSYHSGSFTTKNDDDDIYIDCQPTDACGNTVLIDHKENTVINAGDSSITAVLESLINSPILAILAGVIAIFILYHMARTSIRVIFGKDKIPIPGHHSGEGGLTDVGNK